MGTLVIDGSPAGDEAAAAVREAVLAVVPEADVLTAREVKLGNCSGDFACWTRSPGRCTADHGSNGVAARMMAADRMVWLTPVTFGGYAGQLKRIVEHLIPNISPFFKQIGGETHHRPRYRSYPDLVVIGWLPAPDARAQAVFAHQVARNGINFYADRARCDVVVGAVAREDLIERVRALVDGAPGAGVTVQPLAADLPDDGPVSSVRRAVLLTGSPRTTTSNSHFLGGYLADRLGDRGVEVEEFQVYTTMGSAHRRAPVLESVAAADLLVLAAPLYVDGLPGPVVTALEHVRDHRAAASSSAELRVVALLNCGFPEPEHNATALATTALFARAAGARWKGGLSVGAGEGVIARAPLAERGRIAAPLRAALALAAEALAAGAAIPGEATDLLARPLIPRRLYTGIGQFSWIAQAREHGAVRRLMARPHAHVGRKATS